MSLHSMTGYGKGSASARGLRVEVELSTVNRKQLDIHLSTPRSISALESKIHEEVSRALVRGRVTGTISLVRAAEARRDCIELDEDLAEAFVKRLRDTARRLGLNDTFDGSMLLTLPEVVRFREPAGDAGEVWPVLGKALKGALRELVAMRRLEGRSLQDDLVARFDVLEKGQGRIEKRAPAVVEHYRKALLKRLKDAGFEWALDDERLLKEIAIFADRCDISEELIRLTSHIKQARSMFRSREAKGRSLDFIAQEMFREINTIGSKSNDASITREVIAFKAELERAREQIQNVE